MSNFFFWFLLSYLVHAECPWPLSETTRDDFLLYFNYSTETPCAVGCGIDPQVAIFFTLEEQEKLDETNLVLSFVGLTFTFWYAFNLCLQHQEHSTSLWRADLSYQIPFLINLGYFMLIGTLLFHPGSILIHSDSASYCNNDEKTLSVNDPANGNVACTLLSLFVFVTLKVIISYTTLLSIILFRLFWFPFSHRIRSCKTISHGTIWTIIIIQTAFVIGLNSMKGDMSMRICLPTLESPDVLLWLELIPLVLYQTLATLLLFFCSYKLWKMWVLPPVKNGSMPAVEEEEASSVKSFISTKLRIKSKDDAHSKNLRALTVRLLIFNIFESFFVGLLCFNMFFWHANFGTWKSVMTSVVSCQIDAYGVPILDGEDDFNGTLLESAYDCINRYDQGTPAWSYWLFYVIAMGGPFSGFILTCSSKTIHNYKKCTASCCRKLAFSTPKRDIKDTQDVLARTMESEMVSVGTKDLSKVMDRALQYEAVTVD